MIADPLAEIVTLLQPTVRFSKLVEFSGPWRIRRVGTGDPFFCAVLDGRCLATVDDLPPIELQAGDFVVVPAMRELVNQSLNAPVDATVTTPTEISDGHFRVGRADEPVELRMRIGHCHFGSPDAALLVPLLPQLVIARGEPRLATLMQLVGDETHAQRPARELVLERLLEVLLIEALRCDPGTTATPGLARGLCDDRLAIALRAMHSRPEHLWTVTELASEAALSRSAFFARFTRMVGMAPMEYLLTWRMALAKRLLRERQIGIDQVAERVGYGSASAFSVAFSRHEGIAPAAYARMNRLV